MRLALRTLGLAWFLGLAACASPQPAEPWLLDLGDDTRDLAAWFEREQGQPRAIFLFSPLCDGCVAGARAALEWLATHMGGRMAIIWMPMVPGDDREAALARAKSFPPERCVSYWDESHSLGHAWSAHFARLHLDELREAVRDDPELSAQVEAWGSDPALAPPAWDCGFFFLAGRKWSEPLPQPDAWTTQLGFQTSADGKHSSGTFWCNRSPSTLQLSNWKTEIELGMKAIGAR